MQTAVAGPTQPCKLSAIAITCGTSTGVTVRIHCSTPIGGQTPRRFTPKAALISAVTEAKLTANAPFDSVKKAEAAKMAAKALKDSGWLPEPLRVLS